MIYLHRSPIYLLSDCGSRDFINRSSITFGFKGTTTFVFIQRTQIILLLYNVLLIIKDMM